jgi:hypothetical protein
VIEGEATVCCHASADTRTNMPTWGEIQEYARSKYKLSRDEPEHFSLVWAYDGGRTQQITVRRFTAFEQEWIEFRSAVCKLDEMKTKVALRKNASFVMGALALDDDMYVMLYNHQLATLDLEEFDLPLSVIASSADSIEKGATEADDY